MINDNFNDELLVINDNFDDELLVINDNSLKS